MEKPIDERVRSALQQKRGDWSAIAKSAKVSHSWLSKFVNGKIDNPGLTTLRKVESAIVRKQVKAA